jgi:peptide-methionine (S)-S-oxide reductase
MGPRRHPLTEDIMFGAKPSLPSRFSGLSKLILLPVMGLLWAAPVAAAEPAFSLPNPAVDQQSASGDQVAVLAGGCFWGVQAVFQHTKGVKQAISGYSGGMKVNPTYEEVSSGRTGHAEAVQVTFDPREISYGQILKIFFSVAHNPTQLNRQGPDTGTQYRSAIFTTNGEQKQVATAYVAQLGGTGIFKAPIVTKVDPLTAFYPAEAYHQDYAINHPNQPYIFINDLPKVQNLKKLLPDLYREKPVTVASLTQ